MKLQDIINFLEKWAPPSLQESYDNSRLIIGKKEAEISKVLVALDTTEEVIDEATSKGCNLIISHHPLIFSGIKKIGDTHWMERCIRKAVKKDLNIYAIHTNLDNISTGVNKKIAEQLELINPKILSPNSSVLLKLSVFCPVGHSHKLLESLHQAGAGNIGNYDNCSFESKGIGRFKPNEYANPTIGTPHELEKTEEVKLELILPKYLKNEVLESMYQNHPYEEVAYFLSSLENQHQETGSGMIGELKRSVDPMDFLSFVKKKMCLRMIKHTKIIKKEIKKVAICGGAGRFLLEKSIQQNADIFISSDFKYHDYFEANQQIIIADIGHYESEFFTKELIQEKLNKNFSNLATLKSETVTNPIYYL